MINLYKYDLVEPASTRFNIYESGLVMAKTEAHAREILDKKYATLRKVDYRLYIEPITVDEAGVHVMFEFWRDKATNSVWSYRA